MFSVADRAYHYHLHTPRTKKFDKNRISEDNQNYGCQKSSSSLPSSSSQMAPTFGSSSPHSSKSPESDSAHASNIDVVLSHVQSNRITGAPSSGYCVAGVFRPPSVRTNTQNKDLERNAERYSHPGPPEQGAGDSPPNILGEAEVGQRPLLRSDVDCNVVYSLFTK